MTQTGRGRFFFVASLIKPAMVSDYADARGRPRAKNSLPLLADLPSIFLSTYGHLRPKCVSSVLSGLARNIFVNCLTSFPEYLPNQATQCAFQTPHRQTIKFYVLGVVSAGNDGESKNIQLGINPRPVSRSVKRYNISIRSQTIISWASALGN